MRKSPFLSALVCAAAFLLAACTRSTSDKQAQAIENNLRQYYLAGQQYLLETGKSEARYADLAEGKYVSPP